MLQKYTTWLTMPSERIGLPMLSCCTMPLLPSLRSTALLPSCFELFFHLSTYHIFCSFIFSYVGSGKRKSANGVTETETMGMELGDNVAGWSSGVSCESSLVSLPSEIPKEIMLYIIFCEGGIACETGLKSGKCVMLMQQSNFCVSCILRIIR
jgi:hypothetical protein